MKSPVSGCPWQVKMHYDLGMETHIGAQMLFVASVLACIALGAMVLTMALATHTHMKIKTLKRMRQLSAEEQECPRCLVREVLD